jgi:hypothetical protein
MTAPRRSIGDLLALLVLSLRMLAGRRYWVLPLAPLLWSGSAVLFVALGWREEDYVAADAQNVLISLPLTLVAIGLGVRVVAGEIDRRTLEIAYTVPGGAHRVWLAKLAAALVVLVAAELPLGLATYLFCTEFPPGALYGALQAAVFYLVLALALSTLFRSETAGALVAVSAVVVAFPFQAGDVRLSPFWNPAKLVEYEPEQILAWTTQNRIGFALAIAALVVLAFGRAENREALLSG